MSIFSKLTNEEYHSKARGAPSKIGFFQFWGFALLLGGTFMVLAFVAEIVTSIF